MIERTKEAAELRRRAEERLSDKHKRQGSEADDQRTTEETARLVHELQVHQIELEMQNEELQQARATADVLLAQYTELYDFAPTSYLTLDREGAIRLVNLTGTVLLGVERSWLVKRRFGQFVAEADRRAFSDFLTKVFASEAKQSCEVTLPREGSTPLVVRIECRRSEDGQECRAVVLDITERKLAEENLRQSEAKLELRVKERTVELTAANEELEAFAYSVSHDLRAPLRGIDGFSKALLDDYRDKLDDTGKDYLNRVRAGAQRMARLIDDLLQLSRLTRAEMRHQRLDLGEVARKIADGLQKGESKRQVDFDIAIGISARGDRALLEIAIENLLRNAWKFSGKRERAKIELGVAEQNGERVYYVRDDGAGFDMAFAGKLFGAFQRLHDASEFPGNGIGLALVKRVITRHGGRIWAKGEVDKGATFYFTLPTTPPKASEGVES